MTYENSLELRNLTKEDEALLANIGVTSKAQFDRLGAEKTYALLQAAGHEADGELLYRLQGAERDIDWKILAEKDKHKSNSLFFDVDESA